MQFFVRSCPVSIHPASPSRSPSIIANPNRALAARDAFEGARRALCEDRFERRRDAAAAPADPAALASYLPRVDGFLRHMEAGAAGHVQADGHRIVSELLWDGRDGRQAGSYEALFAPLRLSARDRATLPLQGGGVSGRGVHRWVLAVLHETRDKRVDDRLRAAAIDVLNGTLMLVDDALAGDLATHRMRLVWLRATLQRRLTYHAAGR
jgi:hypothetical protein